MRDHPEPQPPPPPDKRAFVVFVMFNDSYVPGALTAAYGLDQQRSESKRVCVVTPEISQHARQTLRTLYDKVVEVPPIGVPASDSTSSQIRTGSARVEGAAMTRFASLRLGPDGDLGCSFEKVISLDADLLPIRDFEDLWLFEAPAGIINERRSHMADITAEGSLSVSDRTLETGKWVWHDIYEPICPPGAPIPKELTDRVATDPTNYGVNASLVVQKPSVNTFDEIMTWSATPEIRPLITDQWPWVDQQAATLFWSGQWTNIDVSYSTLYGYPSVDLARGLHFAGVKPWSWRKKGFERRITQFPDYMYWAKTFLEMLEAIPELQLHTGLRKIANAIRTVSPSLG